MVVAPGGGGEVGQSGQGEGGGELHFFMVFFDVRTMKSAGEESERAMCGCSAEGMER